MKYYIGIDAGKSGALAIIRTGEVEGVLLIPFDADDYNRALLRIDATDAVCCLERVTAMPKQGVVSMFNFGMNYGLIQGLLLANAIRYELVTPQRWKREFGITSDKNTSIDVCKRLFPTVSLKRTVNSKKDDDGLAEALLLAEFARRHMTGGSK